MNEIRQKVKNMNEEELIKIIDKKIEFLKSVINTMYKNGVEDKYIFHALGQLEAYAYLKYIIKRRGEKNGTTH